MVPACTGECLKYSVLEGQVPHRAVFEKVLGAVQAGNLQTNTAVSVVAPTWAEELLPPAALSFSVRSSAVGM